MRTLPAGITTQKDLASTNPWYVLEIAFSSGTRKYSSKDLSAYFTPAPVVAVVDWGTLSSEVEVEGDEPAITDVSITLQDNTPSGSLLTVFRSVGAEGVQATIKVGFDGSGSTTHNIFVGKINSPVVYNQELRHVTINISSVIAFHDKELMSPVSRSGFPYIAERDNGKLIPLVYGTNVKSVEALQLIESPRTALAGRISATATSLIVDDASRFPQGTPCTIRIGFELITGTFAGNLFTVTARGDVFLTGTTTNMPLNGWYLVDATLNNYPDNYFNNMFVQIAYPPPFGVQNRIITAYDGANGQIYFTPPFSNATGNIVTPGTPYIIRTWPWLHEAGEEVVLHLTSYKWVVADAQIAAVNSVQLETALKETGRATVPPRAYTVNLADGGVIAGRLMTTITTAWEPLQAVGQYTGVMVGVPLTLLTLGPDPFSSNRMFCEVNQGMSHPVDIIYDVLVSRLGFLAPEIDIASFTAVQAATSTYAFGFWLSSQIRGITMVGQLCFQAAYTTTYDTGLARLHRLTMTHSSLKTVSREETGDDSPSVEHREMTEVINSIVGVYHVDGEERTIAAKDSGSIGLYKEHTKTLDLWAIDTDRMARFISYFWLYMYSYPYELLVLDVYLTELELEPLDDITLSDIIIMPANQVARIMRVDHHGGGESAGIDRIGLTLRVPITRGCISGCETICEQAHEESVCTFSGCEAGCEVQCQYACQGTCQEFCELNGCTAGCEVNCMTIDEEPCFDFVEVGCDPNVEV